MEVCVVVWHILQKLSHVFGVPHKASGWVFDREKDSMLHTLAAQFLGALVQKVGGCNFGRVQRTQIGQAIRFEICPQNGRIVAPFALNESGSAGSPARRGKVYINAPRFLDDVFDKSKIGCIC
jgi:hypothetical protein